MQSRNAKCVLRNVKGFLELPLPLGEGWGEGIAKNNEEESTLLSQTERGRKNGLSVPLSPHPDPLPKGGGSLNIS